MRSRAELRENRERLNQIKLESRARPERSAVTMRNAVRNWWSAALSSQAELAQARERLAALEAELDSNRKCSSSAALDLAAAQQKLAASQQEATAAAEALAELEQRQENSRGADYGSSGSASDLRNQLTQAEERLAAFDREGQRLQSEMAIANSQVEAFGGQRGQLALEFETVSQRVTGLTEEIIQTRRRSTPNGTPRSRPRIVWIVCAPSTRRPSVRKPRLKL